jgi:hypothetical protein
MANLKQVLTEAKASVYGGKAFEQRIADGGFSLRVQRTTTWNSMTPRVAIHVWHREEGAKKSRLLKKSEWLKLVS